jgi:formylglycine-generating enzyme required for sulfatase activity
VTTSRKNSFIGRLAGLALLVLGLAAATFALAAQAQAKASAVAGKLGLEFVLIQPGTFVMGAEPTLERFTSYALPKHQVTITKAFMIGKYEVTQRQWNAVMSRNPSKFKAPGNPVDTVTWDKAQEFVDKLNEMEGRRIFRLPTEAEWEYAARAGTETVFPFGNAALPLGDYAWFTNNSGLTTHPVGQKRPNPWGLYDILGNVREWTSDWMSPYDDQPAVDPKGPETGTARIARGGAFNFIDLNCGVSRRVAYAPDSRQNFLGLRLVMDLEPDPPAGAETAKAPAKGDPPNPNKEAEPAPSPGDSKEKAALSLNDSPASVEPAATAVDPGDQPQAADRP